MPLLHLATTSGLTTLLGEGGIWEVTDRALEGRDVWVVAHDPIEHGLIFAGSYGDGLYRNAHGRWERIGEQEGLRYVRAIAFDPRHPTTLYVGTEPAGVFRSVDLGVTWRDLEIDRLPGSDDWSLPYSPRAGAVRTLTLHSARPGLIYGGVEQGGVLRSLDGGEAWSITTSDQLHTDIHSLSVHPGDPDIVFAATGGGLYRSRDMGRSWTALLDGYVRGVLVHPLEPGIVIAGPARAVGRGGHILISRDGGDTWSLADDSLPTPMPDMVESFAVSPDRPGDLYAVRDNGHVIHADLESLEWRPLEPDLDDVRSLDLVFDSSAEVPPML